MKKDNQTVFLQLFSVTSAVIGVLVLIVFLFKMGREYQVFGDNPILMEKTGQVGDFIGGVIGSIWAFTGVLLFYSSLRLQRKEFSLQRKELVNQRVEFRINRLTNVVFSQLSRVESVINSATIMNEEGTHISRGFGISYLANSMSTACMVIKEDELKIDLRDELGKILRNRDNIYTLLKTIDNSLKVINRLIKNSTELDAKEKEEVKFIFTENVDADIIDLIRCLNLITTSYFSTKESDKNGEEYDLAEPEVVHLSVKQLTDSIIEEIKKYNG